ncbi:unnamed protein product [Ostreobium quekettii]|uniref:Uncharacterized protein n=1 Tax=Ostreobium quekettii TaxID=121088 RepID=A0A8S1IX86_9CHLO|nr:unnamed protein product [Ostreobium quekettii]
MGHVYRQRAYNTVSKKPTTSATDYSDDMFDENILAVNRLPHESCQDVLEPHHLLLVWESASENSCPGGGAHCMACSLRCPRRSSVTENSMQIVIHAKCHDSCVCGHVVCPGVAVKPTCVSKRAVESLNTYLRPRRIIIVTTSAEACTVFVTFAKNVQCVEEGSILPGVSKETVGEYLEARYKSVDENSEFHGRLLAGWYLQQFLKLGAAEYMPVEPELSQYFLVWDLDMMLLRPLSLFYIPGASRKVHHVQRQTVVNVGGNKLPGYEPSYKRLTGQDLEYAPDGTSFVTHWLVVYKPYMAEFLISIGGGNFTDNPANALHLQMGEASTRWVWRILDSIDPKFVETGFSEYASYVSWVKQNYPESQHVLKRRTWRRNPLGGKLAIIAGMYFRSDGLCCPMEWAVRLMRFFNYQYVGFEIGHYHVCGYTDERHDKGYGV